MRIIRVSDRIDFKIIFYLNQLIAQTLKRVSPGFGQTVSATFRK